MRLNNKGITLIEIIVSIVLISIVLVFLSIMLVDVKDLNDESQSSSLYFIRSSLLIKTIEDDLRKYEEIKIKTNDCSLFNAYMNSSKFKECLRFEFEGGTFGYLGLFYLGTEGKYTVSYTHGNFRMTEIFTDFEKYNLSGDDLKNEFLRMNIVYDSDNKIYYDDSKELVSSNRDVLINIPMIGNDGKDYTISIPYYGNVSINK